MNGVLTGESRQDLKEFTVDSGIFKILGTEGVRNFQADLFQAPLFFLKGNFIKKPK